MISVWRCIEHSPAEASWNMAVDESLFISALDENARPTIRFFQWEKPSITFGYMLKVDDELNVELCCERGVPFIRRITGGGVVFHGCDITFSIIFPRNLAPDTSSALNSYRFINRLFLRAFSDLGVRVSLLSEDVDDDNSRGNSRNVCFTEPTTYDVLYGGRKLVGNAQRRRKGWVLNHGSILYNTRYREMADLVADAEDAPALFAKNCISIEEVAPDVTREAVIQAVADRLAADLGVVVEPGELSEEELQSASDLAENKYSKEEWNFKRRTL